MLFRISAVPFLIKGVSDLLICVKKGERRERAQVHSRRKKTGLQDLKTQNVSSAPKSKVKSGSEAQLPWGCG